MVREKNAEKKLPSLLIDLPTTQKAGAADLARKERGLRKLRQTDPRRYFALRNNYFAALAAFDQAITGQAQVDIRNFNRRFKK